jgi:chemotaxis protein CheX
MRAEFLNPFIKSVIDVLESTVSETPTKGRIFLRDKYPYTTRDVAIIVGITGKVTGQVVVSLSVESAMGIAARMLMEEKIYELDEYAQSALAEMANMITANATIGLAATGFICDITPPSVITGSQMEISCQEQIKTIVIPLEMSMGQLDLNLSLIETDMLKKS